MLPERIKRVVARLPIVRLIRTHRDERAEAERERQALKEEQHELSRRMHVVGWLAEVKRRGESGNGV
jgi:hypothetical protein